MFHGRSLKSQQGEAQLRNFIIFFILREKRKDHRTQSINVGRFLSFPSDSVRIEDLSGCIPQQCHHNVFATWPEKKIADWQFLRK